MQTNTLYCGNSLELLKQLDIFSNLIILHPPDISECSYNKIEYIDFLKQIYFLCWDKLHKNGTLVSVNTDRKMNGIFAKHYEIMKIMDGKDLFNYKIWQKTSSTNLYIPTFAHVLFYRKDKNTINKEKTFYPDVWLIEKDKIQDYPTKDSFPIELVSRLIKTFTKENDLVLDPFVGSGTSAIVSKQLNRNYIGFDISQDFIDMANKRLNEL